MSEASASPHQVIEDLARRLSEQSAGVSRGSLAEVLTRIVSAPGTTTRSAVMAGRSAQRTVEDASQLAPATVSRAVKALTAEGLVSAASAETASNGGRPAQSLDVGQDQHLVGAAVEHRDGSPVAVTVVLTGLDGERVAAPVRVPIEVRADQDSWQPVIDAVAVGVKNLQTEYAAGGSRSRLLSCGVEVGAHVWKGKVLRSPNLPSWRNVSLSEPLADRLNVPVSVENDVNALAIQELYRSRYPESDLIVVEVFEEGIGGAVVLDGLLRRGGHGMAMEIGHLMVEYPESRESSDAPGFDSRCGCGVVGHMEALATPSRIAAQLRCRVDELAAVGAQPAFDGEGRATEARRIFSRAGRALGRGLVDVINVVNPSRAVIFLPEVLGLTGRDTAGSSYRDAMETAVDDAYSTGAEDARAGSDRLHVVTVPPDPVDFAAMHAVAAACCGLNLFLDHLRGVDECSVSDIGAGRRGATE